MSNKFYEYIAFDAQYFLYRNFAALKSRTAFNIVDKLPNNDDNTGDGYIIIKYNFDWQDLVKQFFWTIVKLFRDGYPVDKIILLWDKGPYYKSTILIDYKCNRVHYCQEYLDEYDIEHDPQGYLQAREEYRVYLLLLQAKSWIINNLGNYGMNSVIYTGYEADDLAYIFSSIYNTKDRKSAICSADSDWGFWISKSVDYINFNNKEYNTYEDTIDKWEYPNQLNISLFEMKSYIDSLFGSHNDLQMTSDIGWPEFIETVNQIKSGDYSKVSDVERFKLNLKSFDILHYSDIDIVKSKINEAMTSGKLLNSLYQLFNREGINVSKSYCDNYLSLLSEDHYNN